MKGLEIQPSYRECGSHREVLMNYVMFGVIEHSY